ncbi:YciI family protein [Pontimicrobium sp. MEBiC06410]
MELNKYVIIALLSALCFTSCKTELEKETTITEIKEEVIEKKQTTKQLLEELKAKGFKTFNYYDETLKDTVVMQQYFIAFLKRGKNRSQNKEEAAKIQEQHQAHLGKMYELGYADISGPMGDDGDIRGITIYNVPTLKLADSLANADPAVKAGRLEIEIHPWWVGKGFPLR